MKISLTLLLSLSYFHLFSQSTALRVYEILQEKCVACHDNASPQSGLDLQGSGNTVLQRALDVYNNIVGVSPANEYAAAKGYHYIYPGRADKSLLFRKINRGLEPTIELHPDELQAMPPYGNPLLSTEETELIRQWILFGAPTTGEVIDEDLLYDYYYNGGQAAFPDGPPPAPATSEGFQIKMGPFFLEPGGEKEYFTKYQLDLPEDMEVHRMEIEMSGYSHHFIMYDYDAPEYTEDIPDGYRLWINHNPEVKITATVQAPTDLKLPPGTAFVWDKDLVLDLNSHYINYSASNPYQAEVYINVYTQPAGTAAQEMRVSLVPNLDIYIPNNGNPVTHSDILTYPAEIFIWILGGHTHRYGTGYKIWKRTITGQKGELLYDGACPQGVPDCVSPFFDYQHIPPRYFNPLVPVDLEIGLIHEATWVNDGPEPVAWGPTSEDEMMLFGMFYVTDTTGLGVFTDTYEASNPFGQLRVYPNPVTDVSIIELPEGLEEINFQLFDPLGREMRRMEGIRAPYIFIEKRDLPGGLYLFRIEDAYGRTGTGKVVIK